MVCSLQATTGEYMSLELLSLYTDVQKYQNLEKRNPHKRDVKRTHVPPPTHPPARKHTHTRMEWTPANTSALPAKQDRANITWNSV